MEFDEIENLTDDSIAEIYEDLLDIGDEYMTGCKCVQGQTLTRVFSYEDRMIKCQIINGDSIDAGWAKCSLWCRRVGHANNFIIEGTEIIYCYRS